MLPFVTDINFSSGFNEEGSDLAMSLCTNEDKQSAVLDSLQEITQDLGWTVSNSYSVTTVDPKETQSQHDQYPMRSSQKANKKGRKPLILGLTKRNDIVLKSLIRSIKRFHWVRFKKTTSYSTKRKYSYEKRREFLRKYIEQEFGMEPTSPFLNTLNLVLFMKKSRDGVNNIFSELLYSFSQPKLENCMKDPYFKCLVYHFSFEAKLDELDKNFREGIKVILNF